MPATNNTDELGSLGIYYGYPSLMNVSHLVPPGLTPMQQIGWTISHHYDRWILGRDVRNYVNTDIDERNRVREILQAIRDQDRVSGTPTEIYGYVVVGRANPTPLDTENVEDLAAAVNQWVTEYEEIDGIFYDEFGLDYSFDADQDGDFTIDDIRSYRTRQNEAIAIARERELKVFVNAWQPSDVFDDESTYYGPILDNTPIANLTPTIFNYQDDFYLAESYLYSDSVSYDLATHEARVLDLRQRIEDENLRVWATSTAQEAYVFPCPVSPPSLLVLNPDLALFQLSALADGFEGAGMHVHSFSSKNSHPNANCMLHQHIPWGPRYLDRPNIGDPVFLGMPAGPNTVAVCGLSNNPGIPAQIQVVLPQANGKAASTYP